MFNATRNAVLIAVAVLTGGLAALAHEGDDHGSTPGRGTVAHAAPRAEAVSDAFEVVAVARNGTLKIYIDRFRSNEPVTAAELTLETPAGSERARSSDDGSYTAAAPWSARDGKYDLIFTIVEGGTAEVLPATLIVGASSESPAGQTIAGIPLGPSANRSIVAAAALAAIIVLALAIWWLRARRVVTAAMLAIFSLVFTASALAHDGDTHGASGQAPSQTTERDLTRREADGSLFVPKPIQRLLAIRTEIATAATHRRTIELPARVIPDPNASGLVQASTGGRLSAPEAGFPRLGSRVTKGDTLAYVTPPLQSIDRSDMRQRQGELDQQISIVERRIVRYESLVDKGGVTQVQLDEARLELAGLRDRRAALDRARAEPEALVAPVSGVIADINAVAGQMAQPSTVLFQIIEPTRLWVEALSFDTLTDAQHATANLGGGRTLPITYEGSGLADRNQAVPVHFRLEGDTAGLRVGQFLTVLATTAEERQGLAVPRASVVRAQSGQDMVFEHASAERFEPRAVRVESLDGERVLIVTGLPPNARVVTQGAELLEQIR